MKNRLIIFALLVCSCLAIAQDAPPEDAVTPASHAEDLRLQTEVVNLQNQIAADYQKMDRLEAETQSYQARRDVLIARMGHTAAEKVSIPNVAVILSMSQDLFFVNAGIRSNSMKTGDKLFVIRRTDKKVELVARAQVARAFQSDSECDITDFNSGFKPEDEVYIADRIGTPFSIMRAHLNDPFVLTTAQDKTTRNDKKLAPVFDQQSLQALVIDLNNKISKYYQNMDRLEAETKSYQEKIKALTMRMSPAAAEKASIPKVALLLNASTDLCLSNGSSRENGLRRDDKLIVVRRDAQGVKIVARGVVARVFQKDAEFDITEDIGGFRPKDEIYVTNRIGTPYSVIRANLNDRLTK